MTEEQLSEVKYLTEIIEMLLKKGVSIDIKTYFFIFEEFRLKNFREFTLEDIENIVQNTIYFK